MGQGLCHGRRLIVIIVIQKQCITQWKVRETSEKGGLRGTDEGFGTEDWRTGKTEVPVIEGTTRDRYLG